jgi:hypothetical glycosyl hydrolase
LLNPLSTVKQKGEKMSIRYDFKSDENSNDKNFIVGEDCFDARYLRKCETILCLGNGYMGVRNSFEEDYVGQTRGCFVAGTYNKFDENEVTELPNAADVLGVQFVIDGEDFDLCQFTILKFERTLNLRTGLSERKVEAQSKKGRRYQMSFKRFVSMDNLHLIAQKIEITPLDDNCELKFTTGVNGRMTNSSVQHFSEGAKRLYDRKYLEAFFTTTQSKIEFAFHSTVKTEDDNIKTHIYMDRRRIYSAFNTRIEKGKPFSFEKLSTIHTTRDIEFKDSPLEIFRNTCLEKIKETGKYSFEELLKKSAHSFDEKVWRYCDVKIESKNDFDQLAVRFAIYHLIIMTPSHDNRMSVAAKGLSGEGYKGHVFWDNEIFCFPFFLYEQPEAARKLLEYRFLSLSGARKKAQAGGYQGAQYPWESAWIDDGETTPVWGAADIITGKATKIWSGFIEIHITGDIAYTVDRYYRVTGDIDFMKRCGFQIIFETAKFWNSRLEYNAGLDRYEINDVVGANEHKEHVNNNAFTNYMAYNNLELALRYAEFIKTKEYENEYTRFQNEIVIEAIIAETKEKIVKLYLPKPNENSVIPEDDTYLSLKNIDLTKYKNSEHVGELFKDYNLEQVNQMQVSKQADVLMVLLLLEEQFDKDLMRRNFDYYEPRTLHDSSLSLSSHCILAKKMGDMKLAYLFFNRASRIDLGTNMESSNDGIHAASLGGIWNCAVLGFGGLSQKGDTLIIEPKLPEEWNSLSFYYTFKGCRLWFEISKTQVKVKNYGNTDISVNIFGEESIIRNELNSFSY